MVDACEEHAHQLENARRQAEVEVGYLERLPAGRLREPVARAVRVATATS